MRTGTALYYLLSDHLGSTSLTVSTSGTLTAELRYKAWGEVRYSSGTMPTKYTYTDQYSNVSDFGLMFYNARWYDPALGRFAQADSIVPAGVEGYDRYAYANNNPTVFIDPSGHTAGCDTDYLGTCAQYAASLAYQSRHGRNIINNPITITLPGDFELTPITPHNEGLNEHQGEMTLFDDWNPCEAMMPGNMLCDTDFWTTVSNGLRSGPNSIQSMLEILTTGYIPKAFGVGGGFMAGFFPAQGTGGVDVLYMSESNSVTVYGYNGHSLNTAGGSLTGGPYAIVALNIYGPSDYSGVSKAINVTAAYGHGATITYFWSGEEPFAPGIPQGFALWYSPGLGASASYSDVNYTPWISIP